jgi:integrase/recombinase XerD
MTLSSVVSQYVAYKQDMGMRFHTEARTLKSFCRTMGDTALADVAADRVHAFIAGAGPVTRFWHRKYEVLRGFYRYAMARGYVNRSPLPTIVPKPPAFVPHIFTHEELQRLLDSSAYCESPRSKLRPHTWRMLILLLYGAALRISEALSLTLADVDLANRHSHDPRKQILQDAAGTHEPGSHRRPEDLCGPTSQRTHR